MKFLVDLLPIILFFIAYQLYDIYVATAVAIAAAAAQVGWLLVRRQPVEKMQWVTLGMLVLFGGLTLGLHDPVFIKWKPTLVNWILAAALLVSGWLLERNLLQRMMGHAIAAPAVVWRRLNLAWALFFIASGLLNLYVAYRFSEATWVNFKLFGLLGLTLIFTLAQGVYLMRHATPTATPEED